MLKLGGKDVKFTGMQYLLGFAHTNFYFHVTTAYNILRHNGIELAQRDFICTWCHCLSDASRTNS